MGCTASKLSNEDSVRRCKERRRLMKHAVYARHHLAAAHSDYCRSLKLTGSALTTFAAGEPLPVADQTPPVLLPTPSSTTTPSFHHHHTPPPPPLYTSTEAVYHTQTRPPPSLHTTEEAVSAMKRPSSTPPPPLHKTEQTAVKPKPSPLRFVSAATEAASGSSGTKTGYEYQHQCRAKSKHSIKLPHILSESSEASDCTPKSRHNHQNSYNYNHDEYTYNAQANYASTPSQASSVWNWENFYPPSPPDSEYFNRSQQNFESEEEDEKSSIYSGYKQQNEDKRSVHSNYSQSHRPHIKPDHLETDDEETDREGVHSKASVHSGYKQQMNNEDKRSVYSNYSRSHHPQFKPHHLETEVEDDEEEREEREEVECSEWGDHYSTTSSTSDEEIDQRSRSETKSRSNFGSSVHNESVAPPPSAKSKFSSKAEKFENIESSSFAGWKGGKHEDKADMRMVIRHRDLTEIVGSIKEYFDKAADAGEQVSEMLETGRAQLDRSFRQLKKTVYHSSGVLSNLSSSWTSKPPLAVKYRFEPGSIGEPGGSKSLCSTLDQLLAWEMKLYQEVKAREGVKIAHEKKLSALQSQEYKGEDESKLNKTKASIKKLQSLIVVTSQAASTTSTAIVGLRDAELVPQLIELCHGFMYMWRSMNQCHEVQNHVVQQVRGLVNQSTKGESTSDLHRQATRELEATVSAWHTSFCCLIKFQRDFIKSLHGWFKLSLLPTNTEEVNINGSQPSAVYLVFDEWKLALDRLPDTVASEAIKSFINVVHSISLKQAEEMKVKKRTESASKELEKKMTSLRSIEKKYYHSYSMVGLGLPGSGQDNEHGLDARDPLSEKRTELVSCQRRVEDEMVRYSKAVEVTRAKTLNNIQTGLPGVFQAMTSFSGLIMEALEGVCNKSYAIK